MNKQDKRIHAILGDDDERTIQNAERYRSYLLENLPMPTTVTGIEDFLWEEPYVLGGWDKQEYEELKKSNPSYTDLFDLQSLDPPDEDEDIVAKVKRHSDGKIFEIGLSWLCSKDKKSDGYILLDDYATWHANY